MPGDGCARVCLSTECCGMEFGLLITVVFTHFPTFSYVWLHVITFACERRRERTRKLVCYFRSVRRSHDVVYVDLKLTLMTTGTRFYFCKAGLWWIRILIKEDNKRSRQCCSVTDGYSSSLYLRVQTLFNIHKHTTQRMHAQTQINTKTHP